MAVRPSPGLGGGNDSLCAGARGVQVTQTIRERLLDIISGHLGVPLERLRDDALFFEDFNTDSLDILDLLFALDVELGIDVDFDEVELIRSVGDALRLVEDKVSVKAVA